MKLHYLMMENYRQFHGEHEIKFSTDGDRNVTVIHGENGSGKTSILNALKYCFYGKTDFDTGEENILNHQAIMEAEVGDNLKLKTEVAFEHDGISYTAERVNTYQVDGNVTAKQVGKSELSLWSKSGDGESIKSGSPETNISQILPENMHPYFFFNGERIEKLAVVSQSHKVQEAIKNLMGLEIVERASYHLRTKVKRYFNDKIKTGATEELVDLIDKENTLEDELLELEEKLEQSVDNKNQYEIELKEVNDRLSILEETASLQRERQKNEDIVSRCIDELNKITDKRKHLISKSGFLVFAKDIFKSSDELLEEKRAKGDLPYKIKQQFIDDILAGGTCICGRDIMEHSAEYKSIESFRKGAGNSDVENEFLLTSGVCKQIDKEFSRFFEELGKLHNDLGQQNILKENAARVIDELSHKIKSVDEEDIGQLENKREKLIKEIDEISDKIGFYKGKINEANQELADLSKKREKLEDKEATAENYHKCLKTTDRLQSIISELYESLANEVRIALSAKVNKTFKDIIRKPYFAEIDNDYCLQIHHELEDGSKRKIIEKSTGENQITSLSFIGSIISHARDRYENDKVNNFYKGGLFPLIMDSPFGALDQDYREKISRYIPQLAEQVIILVSNSQWEGTVEEQCNNRIGREWRLIYFSPEITPDKETYYVKTSTDKEHTVIQEITL